MPALDFYEYHRDKFYIASLAAAGSFTAFSASMWWILANRVRGLENAFVLNVRKFSYQFPLRL